VMNGNTGAKEGSYRQSVWSALERLRHGFEGLGGKGENAGEQDRGEGVMMYSPLEPAPDSQVELAESELEYIDPVETSPTVDPGKGKGKGKEKIGPEAGRRPSPMFEKNWVPSTTKISLYTTWWGYRLYLPPPVMTKLSSSHIKAAARAAMITGALKWFLEHIPLMAVPLELKGPVIALRRLTPLIGYIGVFVAWSWGKISACDTGNGVILTATWLIPVALIPMAWDAGDIHGPSVRPSDTPITSQKGQKTGK